MSSLSNDLAAVPTTARRRTRRIGRAVFGDRVGLVVFLASFTFLMLFWRIGIFITDTYAIGNALVAVADGHLDVRDLHYSLTFGSQPGLYVAGEQAYGRNYAHVFLALPVLWLLEAASFLFDPRLAIAAGWSLLLLGLFDQIGQVVDRHRQIALVGSVIALLMFVTNAALAHPLDEKWLPLIALQLTSMAGAALAGVGLYRLLAQVHDRRVGVLVGFLAVVATPLAFWASIPKRHALSSLAIVVVLAAFYAARASSSSRRALGYRSMAYATVALLAWLHGGEGLLLLAALGPVDLVTARSNHPRRLAVVGVVFLLALTPFLLTNLVIAGNPVTPPRVLTGFDGQIDPGAAPAVDGSGGNGAAGDGAAGDGAAGTATPEEGQPSGGILGRISSILGSALADGSHVLGQFWALATAGLSVLDEPARLVHTFIRRGRIPMGVDYSAQEQEAIELTVLESAPVLAALVGTVAVAIRRIAAAGLSRSLISFPHCPERQTDLLAVTIAVVFSLVYMTRLPTHAMLTVRYLVPVMVLAMYGVGRLGAIHAVAHADWRWLVGSYLGVLAAGGIGFLAVLSSVVLGQGEVVQLHGIVGLVAAVPLVVWTIGYEAGLLSDVRFGVVASALPAGFTTLFLLFSGLFYFDYAPYALPIVSEIVEWLPIYV